MENSKGKNSDRGGASSSGGGAKAELRAISTPAQRFLAETASVQFALDSIPVFGAVLDGLFQKLSGLIQTFENAGEVLLASAGAQVATAIEDAKTAYIDALGVTIDKISALEQKVLNDLTTEVGYIEHQVIDQVRQIVERGSIALNTIPFSNHFPQVGWYSPSYVAPNAPNFIVQFNGNFFDSARQGYDPTLVVNGQTFTASTKTTLQLAFNVPVSVLKPAANDITYITVQLSVPYRKTVLGVIPERKVASFSAMLILLPAKAGSIVFDTDTVVKHTPTQPNQSAEFIQESTDDDIPDPTGSGKVWLAPASPNWFLDPSKVTVQWNYAVGDWTDCGNRSNNTTAAWSIITRHHGGLHVGQGSGQVHFVLHWTEYRDEYIHVPGEQRQDLAWGSSISFDVPDGGTWSATYIDFRGKSNPVSAQTTNPYLTVATSGNKVIISAVP